MFRVKSLVTAGLIAGSLLLASIGAASADSAGVNENSGNGAGNGTCVARASNIHIQNGFEIRDRAAHGVRGNEIKSIHAGCGD